MRRLLFSLLIICFAVQYLSSQSGWCLQNGGLNSALYGVHFIDANTGIAVGDQGKIIKTTNGGLSWIHQTGVTTGGLRKVFFTNSNTGTIVGLMGLIQRTTNGGANWFQQFSGTYIDLCDVHFINANIGSAVAGQIFGPSVMLRTTNGGSYWFSQEFNYSGLRLTSVYLIDSLRGVAGGMHGWDPLSVIWRTTDGGSWSEVYVSDFLSRRISFANSLNGAAVDNFGIAVTTNGGLNWSLRLFGQNLWLNSISLSDPNTATVVGEGGRIFRTTNAGINWVEQLSGTNNSLYDVCFTDALTGTAVGANGTILRTTTGGTIVGITPVPAGKPTAYALHQNYPNPFNPRTSIRFELPTLTLVKLVVYDILGKEVAVIVNQELNPGVHVADWDASTYSSGVYFYRLEAGNIVETKKMILIK